MIEPPIFELKDVKPTPDPIHNYTRQIKSSHTPIVIDNGSYHCRVGWAHQDEPLMIFKNLVAKPRKERGKKDGDTQIGNDIINIEAVRFQLRTQFDRDVVTNLEVQEQIFDHMFSHLGIDTDGCVDHPIVITETFVNPNYARSQMSELLFEAYDVPGVVYGVDALFSLQYSQPQCQDSLVLRLGHQCCHVIPLLDGQVRSENTRRVNLGGFHITNYLHRLLQLRHSMLAPAISLSRVEELMHKHCHIALEFQSYLSQWELPGYQDTHAMWVQLPFTAAPTPTATAGLTPEQQQQRRRDLAKRLGEMNARKRDERLAEDEENLSRLMQVQEMLEDGDDEEYQRAMEELEISNSIELSKTIAQLQARIDKTRQKILAAANATDEPTTSQSVAAEQAELKTSKLLQEMALPKDPEELEAWIDDLKNKRQELLDKRAARRQRRQDMAKRRTAAAQERMRIISQLARKDKRDDNFGMRDEDWDVYKAINKDGGDTDSEEEGERLAELEEVLRRYAPDDSTTAVAASSLTLTKAENYQFALCTEVFRAPELLFQPNMAGHEQGGIAETIDFILKLHTPQEQNRLANNVFITGGVSQFSGLVERLKTELQEMRPFGSTFSIHLSPKPALSAWLGAQRLARNPHKLEQATISRAAYLEKGGDYLVEHIASNNYWPSQPLPEVVPIIQDYIIVQPMEIDVI